MGVDHIEPALRRPGPLAHHPGGEGAELTRQICLDQPLEGPRRDLPHEHPGLDLQHGFLGVCRGAGEDLHLDAPAGEPARGLGDIDIHPAGIPDARLGYR